MKTEETIKAAIKALKEKEITPTQKLVCKESGLSIATIKRHWKGITEGITPKVNRVSEPVQGITKKFENSQQGITNDVQGITENRDRVSPIESKRPNPAFERFKRYKPSGNLKLNPNHL